MVAQGANNKNVGAANNEIMPPQLGLGAEADEEKVVAEDVETTEAMEEGGGGRGRRQSPQQSPQRRPRALQDPRGRRMGGGRVKMRRKKR